MLATPLGLPRAEVFWLFGHHLPGGRDAPHHLIAVHASTASDGLTAAAVNGAISAIVIAAITGYLLMVFQSIDQMTTRIIERAYSGRRPNPGYGISDPIFDADGLSLEQLATVLKGLVRHFDSGQGEWEQGRNLPPVSDSVGRGRALLSVTAAVLRASAFAGGGGFKNVAEVESWLVQIDTPLFSIARDLEAGDMVAAELIAAMEAQLPEPIPVAIAELAYPSLFARFSEWVTRIVDDLAEMRADIEGLQRYEKRRIPPGRLAATGVTVIVANFLVGVAAPLAHPTVSDIFYGWIPAGAYMCALLFASYQVWRYYKERK
jgi:hypothetical protein